MPKFQTYSVVLYGNHLSDDPSVWVRWYDYAVALLKGLGYDPNYVGMSGSSYHGSKIRTLRGMDKKIRSIIGSDALSSLGVMCLPESFKQAAFDYSADVSLVTFCKRPFVLVVLNKPVDQDTINNLLTHINLFLEFEDGEVFEMLNTDTPLLYATRVNSLSAHKSLHILRKLDRSDLPVEQS